MCAVNGAAFQLGSRTESLLQLVWDTAVPIRWGDLTAGSYCSFNRLLSAQHSHKMTTQWELQLNGPIQLHLRGTAKERMEGKGRTGTGVEEEIRREGQKIHSGESGGEICLADRGSKLSDRWGICTTLQW